MTQRSGHACDTLRFCFLYCLIIISKVCSWNYCVLQCQIYFSYFITNTVYGSYVFYKKRIVVYCLWKLQFLVTEISLKCPQKPAAESLPQTVESSPHFDFRIPKTDFDVVFQSICFQFSQVSHAFSVFIHDKMEMIYWKNLVLVDGVWNSHITQLLLSYVHICMFTHGWRLWPCDSSRRDDTFHGRGLCAKLVLCGGPKGIRTLNLVYYLLQLHKGKRIKILVIEVIWTGRENSWT